MAVNKSELQKEIKKLLDSNPEDTNTTAEKLAEAYDKYCQKALFGVSKPTIPSTQKEGLASTLLTGMNARNIDVFCTSVQTGIVTYWTGIPISGGSGSGTSILPSGNIVSTLKTALTELYSTSTKNLGKVYTADTAKALANNMHTLSKTVTASLVIPASSAVIFTLA